MKRYKVLAVNDLSSVGKCSLGVIIPILSAMKVEVCPVVTAVLSAHTAFENPYIVDLTAHLDSMFSRVLDEDDVFQYAYSGYLGSNQQMEIVKKHFSRLKNKGTKLLIDPVLGDNGKLYASFDTQSVEKMKELCRGADLITPNFTEACLLADQSYMDTTEGQALETAKILSDSLCVPDIVITGVPVSGGKAIVIWENGRGEAIPCEYVKGEYCGTGDAFASVVCGGLAKGIPLRDAVLDAHSFVRKAIFETYRMGGSWRDGIMVEKFLDYLV